MRRQEVVADQRQQRPAEEADATNGGDVHCASAEPQRYVASLRGAPQCATAHRMSRIQGTPITMNTVKKIKPKIAPRRQ